MKSDPQPFTPPPAPIPCPPFPTDPLRCCRFCLRSDSELRRSGTAMRAIRAAQLPHTDIPQLFEQATGVPLLDNESETSGGGGHSELLCDECERRMRLAAGIREQFVRIAGQWTEFLAARQRRKTIKVEHDGCVAIEPPWPTTNEATSEPIINVANEPVGPFQTEPDELTRADSDNDTDADSQHQSFTSDPLVSRSTPDTQPPTTKEPRLQRSTAFECDICGARISGRTRLLRHMRTEHHQTVQTRTPPSRSAVCPICGKTNMKRIHQHMRDCRKADRFRCAYCPRTFYRLGMRLQHERQHTGERPFVCDRCAFTFTSLASLKRHALRHTDQQQQQQQQEMNGRPSGQDDDSSSGVGAEPPAYRQQVLHTRIPPAAVHTKLPARAGIRLPCPLCRREYVNRSSLQPHMKLQHGAEGVRAWRRVLETTCLVCAAVFAEPEQLAAHKLAEHMRHQCDVCKRRFQCRRTLELHVARHSTRRERRLECGECGARFADGYALSSHRKRAHTAERPHRCGQCGLGFVERWELNQHERRQHAPVRTVRRHLCAECGEGFRTADALRVHREKHAGRFRYQCGVCGRNQFSGPGLEQHMRSYHVEEWRREQVEEKAEGKGLKELVSGV